MLIIPTPSYSLGQAAWISRLTIWRENDATERREGKPCESWAAAMEASWRLGISERDMSQRRAS